MRYALIATALVGAVAAAPGWAPPAYGGSDDGSWGSASTVDQTTVVTVTSCGAEVTNCPANSVPATYPATTPVEATTPATDYPAPPASTPAEETPYSPEQPTGYESVPPPAATTPATSAPPAEETPYSPEQPSGYESVPPPAATTPATEAPPAETPYSPVGGSAPVPPPAYSSAAPVYPIPGNGSYPAPSGTASGAPSGSQGYPVQQTGNTAAGVKAGSFLAGCGALAALLL